MKKLKLKSLGTGNIEFLSRAQLKNVLGGTSLSTTGGGTVKGSYCNCYCGNGTTFTDPISLEGCCETAEECLSRCTSRADCTTGSMYALCKGKCADPV